MVPCARALGTWKSCINVDHIAKGRWGPSLVDADWPPSAKRHTKGSKEKTGESCMMLTKT